MSWLHIIAVILIVLGAVFHSLQGERLLVTPTLAVDDPFIQLPMTQAITRFGWHSTSGFMVLTALILVLPDSPMALVWATGGLWLILGFANFIMTKAKHPGGPLLSVIGLLILAGTMF